jgi:cytochrome P450
MSERQRAWPERPAAEQQEREAPSERTGVSDADAERNRLFGAGVVDDPYPTYHRLREECPVHPGTVEEHFPVPPGAAYTGRDQYSAFSYAACTDVFRRAQTFSSRWYDPNLTAFVGPTVIGMDEPEHNRMRMLLKDAFSKKAMRRWEADIILPTVDAHLRALLPRGRADLYSEVAAKVPTLTIAGGLGLPAEDRQMFFDWAVAMTSAALPPEERFAAGQQVVEYVAPLVAERRRSPGDDLISILVNAEITDEDRAAEGYEGSTHPLSDDEINAFIRLLIIAGAGTTYRAFGNLMLQLLTHPDQLAAVREDRSLIDGAIHESLRLDQPIAFLGRLATEDTVVQGTPVRGGCPVNVVMGSANHDPEVFPDPERFDVRRPNADRHLTFGFGIHRCLGVNLALSELRILLGRTLDLLEDLRLDPDAGPVHVTGLGFRLPTAVPVVFRAVP